MPSQQIPQYADGMMSAIVRAMANLTIYIVASTSEITVLVVENGIETVTSHGDWLSVFGMFPFTLTDATHVS